MSIINIYSAIEWVRDIVKLLASVLAANSSTEFDSIINTVSDLYNKSGAKFGRAADSQMKIIFAKYAVDFFSKGDRVFDDTYVKYQSMLRNVSQYFSINTDQELDEEMTKFYRVVANEASKISAAKTQPAEAPNDADLGMYAFSPDRKNVPYEENNEYEEKLLTTLMKHFWQNKNVPEVDAEIIKKFLKKNWYVDTFRQPNVPYFWRGMRVNKNYILKALKMDEKTFDKTYPSGQGHIKASFLFEPYESKHSSSWAKDYYSASNFATVDDSIGKGYAVVMVAQAAENDGKFLDCEGLYKLHRLQTFQYEHEVIGFGDIAVSAIAWSKSEIPDDIAMKMVKLR